MRAVALLPGILLAACGGQGDEIAPAPEEPMAITVTSPAFAPGERIPKKHAYRPEGQNVSPALQWSGVPANAKELALLCDDPDAPVAEPWVHWVLYKIPPSAKGLEEGKAVGVAGRNTWDEGGYGGPLPPKGHGTHHYHFKLYALDTTLELKPGATKADLLKAIQGHILAQGELIGTYSR